MRSVLECVYIFDCGSIHTAMDSYGVSIFLVGFFLSCLCTFGSIWLKKIADRKKEQGKDNGVQSAGWVILAILAAICIAGCAYQGYRLSAAPSQKKVHFSPQVQELPPAGQGHESTPEERQRDLDFMKNLRMPQVPPVVRNSRAATPVPQETKQR